MINMELSIANESVLKKYHSKAQIARVLTENWFEDEMYCPNCLNDELKRNPNNTKVTDFICVTCNNQFQLKAQSKAFYSRITDGALKPMLDSIRLKTNPSFFFMQYSNKEWLIRNLTLVPKFFFSGAIIEGRKPLSDSARRKGWIGCNILISKLPGFGRIKVIENEREIPKKEVQNNWKKLFFLHKETPERRAWTSDVLMCIEKLSKQEFTLNQIYDYEPHLSSLHPDNSHIKAKIRQQLQILRDKGILEFKNRGYYVLR